MTERKFAQLLSTIDPALIAEAEASVPLRQKPRFRIALVAAALALVICAALLVVSFIPTTLELDYPANGDMDFENVWIYYTDKNGHQKSEYVRLPYSAQNVFAAWAHLNVLDESAALLEITSDEDAEPNGSVIVTLSTALRDHPNSEALLDSLQKTFAKNLGIMKDNVSFIFSEVSGQLKFSYQSNAAIVQPGTTIEITVTMTNVSSSDVVCSVSDADMGSVMTCLPNVLLYTENDNQRVELLPENFPFENSATEYRLSPGNSWIVTYTFPVTQTTRLGTYHLEILFGNELTTFRNTLTVQERFDLSNADANKSYLQFEQFLKTYGFTSADISQFRSAVSNLTYQGVGMFDIMLMVPVDFADGYDGEEYTSDLFDYGYMHVRSTNTTNNYYDARALSDGMTLPCDITPDDSVIDAIVKLGVDPITAQQLIDGSDDTLISGYPKRGISVQTNNEYGYITITFHRTIAKINPGKNGSSESNAQTVELSYNTKTGAFEELYITLVVQRSTSGTFDGMPVFTSIRGKDANIPITGEDADKLLNILNNGEWVNEILIYDESPGSNCRIGNYTLYYTEGFFMIDGHSLELTPEQYNFVEHLIRYR